jgi:hypothetical protein
MIMLHFVTSKDGVVFSVESDARSVVADQRYARERSAAELEQQGDFSRARLVNGLIEIPPEVPRIAGPLERRAAFRVIQGGRRP